MLPAVLDGVVQIPLVDHRGIGGGIGHGGGLTDVVVFGIQNVGDLREGERDLGGLGVFQGDHDPAVGGLGTHLLHGLGGGDIHHRAHHGNAQLSHCLGDGAHGGSIGGNLQKQRGFVYLVRIVGVLVLLDGLEGLIGMLVGGCGGRGFLLLSHVRAGAKAECIGEGGEGHDGHGVDQHGDKQDDG